MSSRPAWTALGRCGVLAVVAREVWLVPGSSRLWHTADECRVRVNPVEGQCVAAQAGRVAAQVLGRVARRPEADAVLDLQQRRWPHAAPGVGASSRREGR